MVPGSWQDLIALYIDLQRCATKRLQIVFFACSYLSTSAGRQWRCLAGFSRMPAPPIVKETCLDVTDLARASRFYRELFGFEMIEGDDRFCALSVGGEHVLILFLRGATTGPVKTPGGMIPP